MSRPRYPREKAVIKLMLARQFCPSFPRKREPRDFSHLPPVHARGRLWVPLSRGRRIWVCVELDYSLLRPEDEESAALHH